MKFAVFDIDGTIVTESLGKDFIIWLTKKGKFPEKVLREIYAAKKRYKEKKVSYARHQKEIMNAWLKGFKGKKKTELEKLSKKFGKNYNNFFPGSLELIKFFRKKGFYCVVISGAFEEAIYAIQPKFKFDLIVGTEFETKKGKYTGRMLDKMWHKKIKKRLLKKVIKEKKLELKDSFCFGDSEQDSYMMDLVENPIALHPNQRLLEIAVKRKWKKFFDSRKALSFAKQKVGF
jgi:HAD superfamily hydrolase (TIGR01490 family)